MDKRYSARPSGIERRKKIYQYIQGYIKINGYAPSFQEITENVGISNKSITFHHMQVLRLNGAIDYRTGVARSVHITNDFTEDQEKLI